MFEVALALGTAGLANAAAKAGEAGKLAKLAKVLDSIPGLTPAAKAKIIKAVTKAIRKLKATEGAIVDFAESSGRLGGRLWGADRIPTLTKYLEKRGVQVLTNQDDLLKQLAKQRGLNGADAAFLVRKDGRLQFLLSSNPTRREVLHELGHFLLRQKVGADVYDNVLTTAQKEVWVSSFLRNSNNWRKFTPEEQWREMQNILKYTEGLGQ